MKLLDILAFIIFLAFGCWDFGSAFICFGEGRYRLAGLFFGAAVYFVVYACYRLVRV